MGLERERDRETNKGIENRLGIGQGAEIMSGYGDFTAYPMALYSKPYGLWPQGWSRNRWASDYNNVCPYKIETHGLKFQNLKITMVYEKKCPKIRLHNKLLFKYNTV